ncbi:trypsin-like peptidase domain-containing protein [Leucobacter chromiiresistens]
MSTTPEYGPDGRLITPSSAAAAGESTPTPEQTTMLPAVPGETAHPAPQPHLPQPHAEQPSQPVQQNRATEPAQATQPLQPSQPAAYASDQRFPAAAGPADPQQHLPHPDQAGARPEHPTVQLPGAHHPTAASAATATAVAPETHPGSHASGGFGGGSSDGPHDGHRAAKSGDGRQRTGMLLAGLAVGALLGGVAGGGVAAVVSANAPQTSSTSASGNSAITLNNAENATAISGVAAVATPSVVTLEVAGGSSSGSGSGVIYSEDGYIITNAHVVTLDGAAMSDASIRVKLSDGRIFDGSLVGVDPYADLAVVKVDATDLPAIEVADSDKIDVGDLTVAIGAPLNLANTVTSGVVSALNRGISVGSPLLENQPTPDDEGGDDGSGGGGLPWDFRFGLPDDQGQQPQQQQTSSGSVTLPVIQTDASINPGNSGGALLNGNGELIGINVAIASTSTTGETAGSVGLGFAIPANLASRVADAIIAGEQPSHGLLGASVADSSQDTDADANYAGGLLVEVVPDGAAAKAGLQAGDVITAVDGVSAVDGTSVSALIRYHEGGSKVRIDYMRNGEAGQTEATLGTLEW